jgi:hypothetical protein
MAITVTERPSKTLSNGFLSKWSSSELPLQYKLSNTFFPISSLPSYSISNLAYATDKKGVQITFSVTTSLIGKNTVSISGTNTSLDGGIYSIKEVISSNVIVIDVYTLETSTTGTAQQYFTNYKGLVKVFAGAPEQHPYNIDQSKPLEEIGIIEVDFKNINGVNVGLADVRGYIKASINAKFDTDENTHYGWSSYSVQFAETYDLVSNNEIYTFTSDFENDVQENCSVFTGFLDPSFDNGLTDWSEIALPGYISSNWVAGVGSVSTSVTQNSQSQPYASYSLYQSKVLYSGVTYKFDLDITYSGDSPSCSVTIYGGLFSLGSIRVNSSGTYSIFVTPNLDTNDAGVVFGGTQLGKTANIVLNSFEITTTAALPCLFTQWANFGAKQFQDDLGGNFGDYVLNSVDTITPKMLTHFDSKTYFKGKPFYFSAIIPQSTFSLSEDSDNVYLDFTLDNGFSGKAQILNKGEGVYTVDLEPYLIDSGDWNSGEVRFTITPTNTFSDGDFGTFENQTTTGITMLPNSGGTPNQIGAGISVAGFGYESLHSGRPSFSALNGMTSTNKNYKILTNDSSLSVIEGRTYEIDSYVSMITSAFDPRHLNNGYFYWLPDGYDFSECSVTSFDIVSWNLYDGNPANRIWVKVFTSFVAKTTEALNITLYESIFNDIPNNTGGEFNIDTITFKGPIDYISEAKPVTNSKECDKYGGTLRWLNDLNGWETWNFTRNKTVKEKVSKKIDVIKDYSADWDNSFINGETQKDTIQTTANKSIVLRSQILTTNEKTILEQIKRSARVQYLTDANKWQTVTIRASGYDIIDEEERIHEMQIEINLPDLITQAQ